VLRAAVDPGPSISYIAGIKIHDARMMRLIEVLLDGGNATRRMAAQRENSAG
jgi:hypothetical protein